MRAAGNGGAIILTSSVAGIRSGTGSTAYSASKAAVVSIAQTCANQLAGTGIRVNAICPGLIETGMTAPVFEAADARGKRHKIGQLNPLKRYGVPAEIAGASVVCVRQRRRPTTTTMTMTTRFADHCLIRESTTGNAPPPGTGTGGALPRERFGVVCEWAGHCRVRRPLFEPPGGAWEDELKLGHEERVTLLQAARRDPVGPTSAQCILYAFSEGMHNMSPARTSVHESVYWRRDYIYTFGS